MGNMSENLFQAIDILTAKKLEGLKFDKTLLCEIVDNKDAKLGQYRVNDGTTTFVAYSDNTTYKNGMSVYVTIPEGDYSNRKIITGKYVENGGEHYTYVAPFESYLDVTNNYIDSSNNQATLLANGDRNEKVLWTWIRDASKGKVIPKEYSRMGFKASFQTWLGYLQPVTGSYGIRIDVTSREETKNNSSKDSYKHYSYYMDSSDFYGDIYNFETYYPQEIVFDISSITEIEGIRVVFYQSSNFYTLSKEKIATMEDGKVIPDNIYVKDAFLSFGFDSSEFIEDTIFLYTLDGETYDPSSQNVKTGELVDKTPVYTNKNKKLLQLRWVHFIDEKETFLVDNQDELFSVGATVHWYRYQQEEGVCDELAGHFWKEINLDKSGKPLNTIDITVEPDITLQYERYKVIIENPSYEKMMESVEVDIAAVGDATYYGAYDRTSDKYIETKDEADFASGFSSGTIDAEIKNYETIITELEASEEKNTQALLDFNRNQKATLEFMLRSYRNKVRQIWADAEANRVRYISDTLVLTNETLVPNNATVNLVQGLKILADITGLKGNYCLYGMTNEILNSREAAKARVLEAKYESLVTGEPDLDKASTICWKIPAESTMIAAPVLGTDYVTKAYADTLSEDKKKKYTKLDYIATTMTAADGTVINLVDENNNLIPYEGYYHLIREGTEDYSKYDNEEEGAEETSQQISVKQTYKIKKYYQQSATNNTIHCIVYKNSFDYKASVTLNFGHHGSNGSDTTLILQMREYSVNMDGTISPGDLIAALSPGKTALIEARLFNYKNEEVSIDNITWGMWAENQYNNIKLSDDLTYREIVKKDIVNTDGEAVEEEVEIVIHAKKVTATTMSEKITYEYFMHNIVEAQVDYGSAEFGGQATTGYDMDNVDENGQGAALAPQEPETRPITLLAYFPIAFTTNEEMVWAEIPTQIIYDSSGSNPSYYKDIIKIIDTEGKNPTIKSCNIVFSDDIKNASYYPLTRVKNVGEYFLRPNNMYLNGLSPKVSLICETTLGRWVQPIVILQNRWPSAMLNAWDGSLTIDEKNGTILSTMVGAGRKEDDNSFTGVLMGEVESEISNNTGIYGYHHGQQAFGFLDDGTAFLGKAGKGRIEFNGNSGQIKSMSYSSSGGTGMLIDLDDGVIEMKGANGEAGENSNTKKKVYKASGSLIRLDVAGGKDKPYFQVKTASSDDPLGNGESKELIYIGINKYHLQTADYTKPDNSADIETGLNGKGMKIDLMNGYIEGYNFALRGYDNGETNGGRYAGSYFSMNSNGSPYFRIHYQDNNLGRNLHLVEITKSSFYLQSQDWDSSTSGMKIDLGNGKITSYNFSLLGKDASNGSYVQMSSDGSPYFKIYDGTSGVTLMNVGSSAFKFTSLDGSLTIDLRSNRIDATSNFKISANGSGGSITIDSSATKPLVIGSKFSVDWDGSVTATNITATTGGKIGPFTIDSTSLSTGTFGLSGVYLGNSGVSVSSNFKVDSSGNMTVAGNVGIGGTVSISGNCTVSGYIQSGSSGSYYKFTSDGGTIGGWTINTSSLTGGDITLDKTGNIYLGTNGKIKASADSSAYFNFYDSKIYMNGAMHCTGTLTTGSTVTLGGNTSVTGTLTTTSTVTLGGNTTINGNLTLGTGSTLTVSGCTGYTDANVALVFDIPGWGIFNGSGYSSAVAYFKKGLLVDAEYKTGEVDDVATSLRDDGYKVIG